MKVDISIDIQTSYFTNASQRSYRFSRLTLCCVTLVDEDDMMMMMHYNRQTGLSTT